MLELCIALLLIAGGLFTFMGALGLARLRDFHTRLHGPTKTTTLGVGCLLIASMLFFTLTSGEISMHELLVVMFLFITAPLSAHLLAKAALHRNVDSLAPPPRIVTRTDLLGAPDQD